MPYHNPPRTLGEHLRKRRHELGLYQKDVAEALCINQWTLIGWESDRKTPAVRFMPRIIEFLGYDPFPALQTLGEKLRATRRRLGLSQQAFAHEFGLDEGTVRLIEAGRRNPSPTTKAKIEGMIATILPFGPPG